ncbi:MAG: cupin domain-containing protein [Xanthobacteraceae bacterium]
MTHAATATSTTPTAEPIHVPAGEGKAFWGPGDRYHFLVTGAQNNGGCFILEAIVPPGGGPPPHLHWREDEYFYLIEGSLSLTIGARTVTASAGDFVAIPRGCVHAFHNNGDGLARMLAVFTPAGMEGWMEECLDPAPDKTSLPGPPTPELIARMLAAGPKYGVEWVK